MRKYTDKFVVNRLFQRLHAAVCPFPGKHPLRMLYRAGGKVRYHGKFHASAWRQMLNGPAIDRSFLIYDKAGAVIWGTNPRSLNISPPTLMYRYFGSTWMDSNILKDVVVQSIGQYRVYLNETSNQLVPVDRPRFIHYVNSNVARIRTI